MSAVGFITKQFLSYLKQLVHKQVMDLNRDPKTPIYPPVVHTISTEFELQFESILLLGTRLQDTN